MPKHGDVTVKLVGQDSNAASIIGKVAGAIRRVHGDAAAAEYTEKAMGGDFNNVLSTSMDYVNVE